MISIVVATYNRATTLPRAVGSVLRQSFSDWELVIVDDGSTDETPQFLASLQDPRIFVYRHPHNRGVAAADNTGFDHIHGEWFTLLGSDDEMMPDALSVMMECVTRTGATAITCNGMDFVTGRMTGIGPTHDGRLSAAEAATCKGDHWGLTKTSLLGDLRFDERLPSVGNQVWLKINRVARRYYIHRALVVVHREGADRVTVANRRATITDRVRVSWVLGQDRAYLEALKTADPQGYRHLILRVWVARVLRRVAFRSEQW